MSSAILLVNVGSPKNASRREVAKFLLRYLNDKRVVSLPLWARMLLVNGVIIPSRLGKSAKRYREFFAGAPLTLLHHAQALEQKLNEQLLPHGHKAFVAMQHSRPTLPGVLRKIKEEGFERVTLVPLFPQYAEATSGSVAAKFRRELGRWKALPEASAVESFYSHPAYIRAVVGTLRGYDAGSYDHVVFSYHSLPMTHVARAKGTPRCYPAACEATSRLVAEQLKLDGCRYSVAYQSRMSPHEWLGPSTDDVLATLAGEGKKRALLLSPGMVADCLETVHELARESRTLFLACGGHTLDVAPCLNSSDEWVEALTAIAGVNINSSFV